MKADSSRSARAPDELGQPLQGVRVGQLTVPGPCQPLKLVVLERPAGRAEVVGELLLGGGTDDRSGDAGLLEDPTQGHLAAATVIQRGGRSMGERHDYDEGVVMVMADSEGNEFCLVQHFS